MLASASCPYCQFPLLPTFTVCPHCGLPVARDTRMVDAEAETGDHMTTDIIPPPRGPATEAPPRLRPFPLSSSAASAHDMPPPPVAPPQPVAPTGAASPVTPAADADYVPKHVLHRLRRIATTPLADDESLLPLSSPAPDAPAPAAEVPAEPAGETAPPPPPAWDLYSTLSVPAPALTPAAPPTEPPAPAMPLPVEPPPAPAAPWDVFTAPAPTAGPAPRLSEPPAPTIPLPTAPPPPPAAPWDLLHADAPAVPGPAPAVHWGLLHAQPAQPPATESPAPLPAPVSGVTATGVAGAAEPPLVTEISAAAPTTPSADANGSVAAGPIGGAAPSTPDSDPEDMPLWMRYRWLEAEGSMAGPAIPMAADAGLPAWLTAPLAPPAPGPAGAPEHGGLTVDRISAVVAPAAAEPPAMTMPELPVPAPAATPAPITVAGAPETAASALPGEPPAPPATVPAVAPPDAAVSGAPPPTIEPSPFSAGPQIAAAPPTVSVGEVPALMPELAEPTPEPRDWTPPAGATPAEPPVGEAAAPAPVSVPANAIEPPPADLATLPSPEGPEPAIARVMEAAGPVMAFDIPAPAPWAVEAPLAAPEPAPEPAPVEPQALVPTAARVGPPATREEPTLHFTAGSGSIGEPAAAAVPAEPATARMGEPATVPGPAEPLTGGPVPPAPPPMPDSSVTPPSPADLVWGPRIEPLTVLRETPPAPAEGGPAPMPIAIPSLLAVPTPAGPPAAVPVPATLASASPAASGVTTPAGALVLLPNEDVISQLGALYLTNKRAILYAPTILRAAFIRDIDAVGTLTERASGWSLFFALVMLAAAAVAGYIGWQQGQSDSTTAASFPVPLWLVGVVLAVLGLTLLASYFFYVKKSLFLSVGGRPLIVISLSGWSAKRLESVDAFINAFSQAKDRANAAEGHQ